MNTMCSAGAARRVPQPMRAKQTRGASHANLMASPTRYFKAQWRSVGEGKICWWLTLPKPG